MAHDLKTNDIVTNAAVTYLEEMMPFVKKTRKLPSDEYRKVSGSKPGESIRLKKPPRFEIRTGDAMVPQGIIEPQVTLNLEPLIGVDVEITDRQWKLELAEFSEQVIKPAMITIASHVEALFTRYATQATANSVGTPGVDPTSTLTYLAAGADLTNLGAPRADRSIILPAGAMAAIVNAVEALQNPSPEISKQNLQGFVTRRLGFDWFETTSEYVHTNGLWDTGDPLVDGAGQSGAALVTNGWASGTTALKKGDVFWIDGVFQVHPQNKNSTGVNQRFVVTADIADTSGAITVPIDPPIKGPGDPHQNVSALPANDAVIVMQGSTVANPDQFPGVVSAQGLAWHPDAFMSAFVELPKHSDIAVSQVTRDSETGIAIRLEQQTEIRTSSNLARFDVLCGFVAPYPELAARIWAG